MEDKNKAANEAARHYLGTEVEAAFALRALELEFLKEEHKNDKDLNQIPFKVLAALDQIFRSLKNAEGFIESGFVNMARDVIRRQQRHLAEILKEEPPLKTHPFDDYEINGKAKTERGKLDEELP